jgi:hypothetical protein
LDQLDDDLREVPTKEKKAWPEKVPPKKKQIRS